MCYDIWDLSKKYYTSTVLFQTSRDSVWFNAVSKKSKHNCQLFVYEFFDSISDSSILPLHIYYYSSSHQIDDWRSLKNNNKWKWKEFSKSKHKIHSFKNNNTIAAHIHTTSLIFDSKPALRRPLKKRHTGHAPVACLPLFSLAAANVYYYYYYNKKDQAKIIKFVCPPAPLTTSFPA